MDFDTYRHKLTARTFEEINRVIATTSPRLSLAAISEAIGRNRNFLADVKKDPERYNLSLKDLFYLQEKYGIDRVYITEGFRFEAFKKKAAQILPLLGDLV